MQNARQTSIQIILTMIQYFCSAQLWYIHIMTDNSCQFHPPNRNHKAPHPSKLEDKPSLVTNAPRLKKYKFNISMDNLQPFLGKQHKHHKKTNKISPGEQGCKVQNSRWADCPETGGKQSFLGKRDRSVDLPLDVSNSILEKIESVGVGCKWWEGQEGLQEDWNDQEFSHVQWGNVTLSASLNTDKKTIEPEKKEKQAKIQSLASTSQIQPNNYIYNTYMGYQYSYYQRQYHNSPQYYKINTNFLSMDPRTTLMIKNVPNKYTIKYLSQEIDSKHENTYDFLYLPFDMKNNCNVGYGFINFIDTKQLQKFYYTFQGRKWNKFYSQKICQLSYARLQGLDQLIQHFQNSKVLNSKQKQYQPIIRRFARIQTLLRQQKLQKKNHF